MFSWHIYRVGYFVYTFFFFMFLLKQGEKNFHPLESSESPKFGGPSVPLKMIENPPNFGLCGVLSIWLYLLIVTIIENRIEKNKYLLIHL